MLRPVPDQWPDRAAAGGARPAERRGELRGPRGLSAGGAGWAFMTDERRAGVHGYLYYGEYRCLGAFGLEVQRANGFKNDEVQVTWRASIDKL